MKVAIKWKGEELKYVDVNDLALTDTITVKDFKDATDKQFEAFKQELHAKQEQIDKLTKELQGVKLENIEVVKGLISR